MRNRRAAAAATAVALALLAAACSNEQSSDRTTITFSFYGESTELEAKLDLIEAFEEAHPDIDVQETYTTGTQYPTKLETYFSSNTAPDVMAIGADNLLPAYLEQGVFADLQPLIDADAIGGSWDDELVEPFTADDLTFGVPWGWKSLAIAYNKDLFEKAGVPEPEDDWTEESLVSAARALAQLEEPAGRVYGFDPSWYLTWGMRNMYGDPNYDIESATMTAVGNESYRHGVDLFASLIADGVSPVPGQSATATAGFPGGLVAMQVIGAWDPASYQEQIGDRFGWDLVRLPADSEFGAWMTPLFADGLAISANSSKQEAAWELVKFLTTDPEAQKTAGTWGYPALESVVDDFLTSFPEGTTPYNKAAFVDAPRVAWLSGGVWQTINDEEATLFNDAAQGSLSVDDMIKRLQQRGEDLLGNAG